MIICTFKFFCEKNKNKFFNLMTDRLVVYFYFIHNFIDSIHWLKSIFCLMAWKYVKNFKKKMQSWTISKEIHDPIHVWKNYEEGKCFNSLIKSTWWLQNLNSHEYSKKKTSYCGELMNECYFMVVQHCGNFNENLANIFMNDNAALFEFTWI